MEKLEFPKPDRELHDTYIIVEPNIGVAVSLSIGAMLNFIVSKDLSTVYSADFQRFREMAVPVMWAKYVRI